MVNVAKPGRVSSLLDFEMGTIQRELFCSPELHQQEQERVFARAWLFVGHESQVPNPNDFFVSRMGEESVIMTRDRQGEVHVLLNTCMHRGMKVCRYDEGNTPVFSCPYHGWSFSTDGKLVSVPGELIGVPQFATAYHGELEKENWGLVCVPKMHNYKGSIWATWDKNAPEFLDYVGGFKPYLDGLFDHRDGREGGSEVICGVQKWRVPCNWKFSAENFAGDMYHGISHQSVELVGIGPGGTGQGRHGEDRRRRSDNQNGDAGGYAPRGITSFPDLGHCARGGPPAQRERGFPVFHSATGPLDNITLVQAYLDEVWEKRQRTLEGKLRTSVGGNVFPNMSFHAGFPRTILVSHPVGPMEMEMWRWFLVDADSPKEVKDLLRHYYTRYSGPGGMTEQDDMENWNYAAAASTGTIAKRFPYNYMQGVCHALPAETLPGAVVSDVMSSEENARTLYRRWAQFMDAESWDDLYQKNQHGSL